MISSFTEGLSIQFIGGVAASIVVLLLIYFRKKLFPMASDSMVNPIAKVKPKQDQNAEQKVEVNVNVDNSNPTVKSSGTNEDLRNNEQFASANPSGQEERRMIIDSMKSKVRILFIDDDKEYNMVKILKSDGWKHTETTEDIRGLDIPLVKRSDVFFVDINGVGKLLNCEYQGLDLAQMLKEKYPNKTVVIYSANENQHAFHPAWDICDKRLEKNALPNQFEKIVEDHSLELYRKS